MHTKCWGDARIVPVLQAEVNGTGCKNDGTLTSETSKDNYLHIAASLLPCHHHFPKVPDSWNAWE